MILIYFTSLSNMDALKSFLSDPIKLSSLGVCVAVSSILIWKVSSRKKKLRVCGVDYPRDVVIIHEFGVADYAPSMGHFVMKLETYLRIAKIPFKPVFGFDMGPKGKVPWIEYNGTTMGDSQLIINFLNQEFKVDLNKQLNEKDRALAWAIQKWIEEFTYHLNVYTRWCLLGHEMYQVMPSRSKYWISLVTRFTRKAQHVVGTARHTKEEVHEMMMFDLRQLSVILGEKKFLMGTEGPAEVDCAVFGILSQVLWHTPDSCPGKQLMKRELTNLMEFIDRIKQQYWPDWDERTTTGSKKK